MHGRNSGYKFAHVQMNRSDELQGRKSYTIFIDLLLAMYINIYVYGLVQDCSNSSALALELLQACTKPSIW